MEKLNLAYLTVGAAKSYSFYMIPKELIDNPAFDDIDYGAKLFYALALNRTSLSANNPDFIDDKGNVYIIYTIEQVMEDMRCSRQTAVNMLKQLDEKGLIEKRRLGQGKPSIIYVKDFSTVDFKKSKKCNSRSLKNRLLKVQKIDSNHTNQNHTDSNHTDHKNLIYPSLVENDTSEIPLIDNLTDNDRYDTIDFINNAENNNLDPIPYPTISFDNLNSKYPDRTSDLKNLQNIIIETFISSEELLHIAKSDLPLDTVKQSLSKLTDAHIEYLLKSLIKNKANVKHSAPYLLTALFNTSKMSFDDLDSIKEQVKNKIDLEHLQTNYPKKHRELQELYDIIVETLSSRKMTMRIAKEDMPADIVKQQFSKLNYLHLEYVLESLRKTTSSVKSTKSYLQTALFNAPNTINNHYSLAAQNTLSEHFGIDPK